MPPRHSAGFVFFFYSVPGVSPLGAPRPGYHMPPAQARVLIFRSPSVRRTAPSITATMCFGVINRSELTCGTLGVSGVVTHLQRKVKPKFELRFTNYPPPLHRSFGVTSDLRIQS